MAALTALAAFLGLGVGMTLLLYALAGGKVGIVSTLSATSPVIILPMLWARTGERPARRRLGRRGAGGGRDGADLLAGRNLTMGRLEGKLAIISGGATGMGGASSRLFAAEGATVAIIDRNAAAAAATAAEIRAAGGKAESFVADVSDEGEVQAAVGRIERELGPARVLFNHAGTIVIKPFLETTVEEWDWLHAVNVRSMFLVTRAVLPGMIAVGGGSIVCTSSISAVAATPMEVLYDTTKARRIGSRGEVRAETGRQHIGSR